MIDVLFLDDSRERHIRFRDVLQDLEVNVWHAYDAMSAIRFLNERQFDQVFLDHDLSEQDIMIVPGQPSHVPTGMTVVDHIVKMHPAPPHVIVHSLNDPAAWEMVNTIRMERPEIRVDRIGFLDLIPRIERAANAPIRPRDRF